MWTSPTGQEYAEIPPRWEHDGRVIELAGDARRARRNGWCEVVAVEPLPDVPPTTLSKLGLRLALRKRGLEEALDAMLTGTAAKDWADATVLRLDYPLFAAMLPAFQAAAGLTDQQIADMIEEAKA